MSSILINILNYARGLGVEGCDGVLSVVVDGVGAVVVVVVVVSGVNPANEENTDIHRYLYLHLFLFTINGRQHRTNLYHIQNMHV